MKEKTRWAVIENELKRIDGVSPGEGGASEKHKKMARSPFQFLRGSAQLFYADLASQLVTLPPELLEVPNTSIVGDCHFSNFGFFTEEGSHGQSVIWAPNDFDDACEGPAAFDLLRVLSSFHLVADYLDGLKSARYQSEELDAPHQGAIPSPKSVIKACDAFVEVWLESLEDIEKTPQLRDEVLDEFGKKHFLHLHHEKARQRTPQGKKFLTKSTVCKLAELRDGVLRFKNPHEKMAALEPNRKAEVIKTLRPYMDDTILDVALRLGAGTGSVNVDRFYLLVGPDGVLEEGDLSLAHVVEVKQQREAAMIHHFPDMSPVNQLYPAHLTVDCQRKMMRRPDLLLDDLDWQGHHWLIRSRHNARYGVDPEDILEAENPDKAFIQYAKACAEALALAHARGDRRSTRFEQAVLKSFGKKKTALLKAAQNYSAQVIYDHGLLVEALKQN